jgi:soluble lytic murein transglycosylase-like protein
MHDEKRIHSPPTHPYHRDRKVALGAAFQWSPVALAFLLSSICLAFLVNFHPASATSANTQDPLTVLSLQTDPASSKHTSEPPLRFLSPVFTKEVLFWEEEILEWANTYHLDPNLVAVVMQIESCGHPDIESGSGAKGLFQVMPFHFTKDEDPFDPDTNAYRGLSYLSKSLNLASNDTTLALAGYNGGHGVISLEPSTWFEETKRYVYWGSGILEDINAGATQSSILKEWMLAGGESLCNRSSTELGLEF